MSLFGIPKNLKKKKKKKKKKPLHFEKTRPLLAYLLQARVR